MNFQKAFRPRTVASDHVCFGGSEYPFGNTPSSWMAIAGGGFGVVSVEVFGGESADELDAVISLVGRSLSGDNGAPSRLL